MLVVRVSCGEAQVQWLAAGVSPPPVHLRVQGAVLRDSSYLVLISIVIISPFSHFPGGPFLLLPRSRPRRVARLRRRPRPCSSTLLQAQWQY